MPVDKKQLPLLERKAKSPIAILTASFPALEGYIGLVSAADFLSHINALADQLPSHGYVINVCENRYLFAVTFCAVVLRGQTNLLPPNKKRLTLSQMQDRYGDVYILHDGLNAGGFETSLPQINCSNINLITPKTISESEVGPEVFEPPLINKHHVAAISFTSGSTGESKSNIKTWQTIYESSKINAHNMLEGFCEGSDEVLYQLATVPPQHMWGLETSVLIPFFAPVCVLDSKPLFPKDIFDALLSLPNPRMLVTTPVHLRALNISELRFPPMSLVLCATSPLSQELARQTETLFTSNAQTLSDNSKPKQKPGSDSFSLREVYGCSEVGSMAIRQPAQDESWMMFDGITLTQEELVFSVSTSYLPEPIMLQDNIIILENGRFQLDGRASDLINIAGKRGSLVELNKVLLNFPGIIDGIIFMPDIVKSDNEAEKNVSRLAGLVVLNSATSLSSVKTYLAEHFDSAFVPRPIIEVDALPREENGKLPLVSLQYFYKQLKYK